MYAILMTTCVSPQIFQKDDSPIIRKKLYEETIMLWLTCTNLDIYVMESSGSTLDIPNHPRINMYSFTIPNDIVQGNSSIGEAMSIQKAMEYFGLVEKYEFIVKVTGRYFVPELESFVNNVLSISRPIPSFLFQQYKRNLIFSVIFQDYIRGKNRQPSEIFGFKSNLYKVFTDRIINHTTHLMEESLHEMSSHPSMTIYRMPKLKLHKPVKRGGDRRLMYNI